jgi:secreted trypsin-like serine protease
MRSTSSTPLALAVVMALALPAAASAGASGYAVVGGRPAGEGAHPSAVAVLRAEEPDDVAARRCGGTAVAPDLVLTAAHCLHAADLSSWRSAPDLRVVAGRRDLADAGGVEAAVAEVWVHPAYDPRRRRNDVALLRTGGPLGVPVQRLVDPAAPDPAAGSAALVVGWGRTGTDDAGAVLHEAEVPVTDPARCAAAFAGALDLSVHLCAGGDGAAGAPAPDACTGDSGGPLLRRAADGALEQVGITSAGPAVCGVGEPGVYTSVRAVRPFVDAVTAGALPPSATPPAGLPGVRPPGRVEPLRIVDAELPDDPVGQAVAASRAVFPDGGAEVVVLARADGYADALAGSALVAGRGPLLLTPGGHLHPRTRAELRRVLQPGGVVHLLGGEAALGPQVEAAVAATGHPTSRLAGPTREATAAAVADAVLARDDADRRPPGGTVVLATSRSWPDAVVAGQLAAWWGWPLLLTGPEALSAEAERVLSTADVARVVVVGGDEAVGPAVTDRVAEVLPTAVQVRAGGGDRVTTALEVAGLQLAELAARGERPPDAVVAANVRREDAVAPLLTAAPLLGRTAGVVLPVEGEDGASLPAAARALVCGLGGLPVVAGSGALVADAVAAQVADAVAGVAC